MDRFLLDISNLPKAKNEVILQITSAYPENKKIAFIKSLIFLGFSTIKQADIDIVTAHIGKSSNRNEKKYRIILANTPISDFLKTMKNQTTRRSCVYAFLYAGISSYINYMNLLSSSPDKKTLENIEKNLFLCGLADHLDNSLNIKIEQPPLPLKPKLYNTSPDPQSTQTKELKQHNQNESVVDKVFENATNASNTAKKSKKPQFNIDGV